jgi:hypothetical protein
VSDDHQPYPPPPAEPPRWPPAAAPASTFAPLAAEATSGPDTVPGPHRPKAWLVAGLMISALAVIGVATWVGWTMLQDDGPSYPQAWDPRIEDIATFVEDERDLDFLTPVHVDFLADDEFREQVTTSEDDLTDEDREALDDATAQLRALGLVEGDLDLFEEQNELTGEGALAFYDPVDKRITVRGTELTPSLRATLAHEMTHALQDQHFDLQQLSEEAGEDGAFVYRAVIEGDATNVEQAFVEQELTDAERAEAAESDADAGENAYADRAPALVAFFLAPYRLGLPFTEVLRSVGAGDADLDTVLREGLPSEVALFDPTRADEPGDVEELPLPELAEGQELIDDGSFGVFSWFVVLSSRVDPRAALEVVDEWQSDSYVTYDDGGTVCVKARFQGTTDDVTAEMADLLDEWAAAMPAGASSVTRGDEFVELTSCDPGADTAAEPETDALEALQYLEGRLAYVNLLLEQSQGQAELDDVWCVVDSLFDEFTLEELATVTPDQALVDRAEEATQSCLPGG